MKPRLLGACTISLVAMLTLGTGPAAAAKIGAIFDLTGGLNIYGIQQHNALQLAVEEINAAGGIKGEPIEVVSYDAQSDLSKYTQYANTAILKDRISALFAGLTSSSREAIRPIVRKANIPYFYSSLYEGGACDKQTFVTGSSASQQMSKLIEWGIRRYGPRIYIMAPDYNFGTISAHWVHEYAKQAGGEVVGEDFLSLTVTDYSPTLQKIQASEPDFVVALPVGANQTGFLEQFSAAGLKDSIGIVSTNYGSGNQQVVVSPEAGQGIIANQGYFMQVDNDVNKNFVKAWEKKYGLDTPIVSGAVDTYNAVKLFAKAAEKSKSLEADDLIAALESGVSYEAPNGTVTLDPKSHHLRQNIYIANGDDNHGFLILRTFTDVPSAFEEKKCDLISNPKLAEHFTPED